MFGVWVFLCVFVAMAAAATDEKLAMLLKKKNEAGLVKLSDSSYAEYALKGLRNYHLFLLFSASDPRYKCDLCVQVGPEFQVLAASYEAYRNSGSKNEDEKEIIFAVVEYSNNQKAFNLHGFTSAPHVAYVAPTTADISLADLGRKVEIPANRMFNFYQMGKKAENLLPYIRQKTNIHFDLVRSKTMLYLTLLGVLIILAGLLKLVIGHLDWCLVRIRNRKLWMYISFLFYGLSVSGMVFCIIREPPAFGQERGGKIKYFHPAGRQQFVFEGLIVGGYDLMAAICVILLSQWAVYIQNPQVRYLTIGGCMTGFLYMYKSMVSAYSFKNQWYSQHTWF